MKHLSFIVLTSVTLIASSVACAQNTKIVGSKNYITKKIDQVENFSNITVQGSPDVIFTQVQGKPSIEIYAPDNVVPVIETVVEGNTLYVRYKKNTSITINNGKCEIRVSAPTLEKVTIQGSGDVDLSRGIKADNLALNVQGSGDINGKNIACSQLQTNVQGSGDITLKSVKATNVTAQVQGSGDIALEGETENADLKVQGSGDVKAADLKANHVTATVNGSGDISCHAVKTLGGAVSGSGDVGYKGSPEISFSKKGLHKL